MATSECPYLDTSLADVQEYLHSAGLAHEHALSIAVKLSSLAACQVVGKVKATNQSKPVPDELHLSHKIGKWTLKEDIKSTNKFKVGATYEFSKETTVGVEADAQNRVVKSSFVHKSSWAKCEATANSEGSLQLAGMAGNEKFGAEVNLKMKEKFSTYSLAVYAKQPNFDLMMRCVKSPTTSAALNLSYFQQFNPQLSVFALAHYDATTGSKAADVTCTCSYDSKNSMKLQLGLDGAVSCSLVHSLSENMGVAYGLQTKVGDLIRGNMGMKCGLKLKLGLDK